MEAGCHVAVGDYVTTDTIVDEEALTSWGRPNKVVGNRQKVGRQVFWVDTSNSTRIRDHRNDWYGDGGLGEPGTMGACAVVGR